MGSSSLKYFDIAIVSAFSRGVELAHQLIQSNKKVMFIDVSRALNALPEDLSGPFGFFENSLTPRRWVESTCGFSIQTSNESFYFKDFFLPSVYKNRLSFSSLKNPSSYSKKFQVQWIHHLLHQLFSSVETSMDQTYTTSSAQVFKSFGVLKPSLSVEKLLQDEVALFQNVDWKWNAQNLVLSRENKEEFQVQNIVLLLNPEELYHFNSNWYPSFFCKKKISANWSWQRFSFHFNDDGYPFPLYLVLVDPEDLPWTHERNLCLKPSLVEKNKMDVWGSFPAHYSNADFKECVKRIHQKLNQLLPRFEWHCSQESFVTPSFLFPIYDSQSVKKIKTKSSHLCGWPMQDMSENGWLQKERKILQQISQSH